MSHEFRLDRDRLDEFVAHDAKHVHLEWMNTNDWWLGVTLADGRDVRFCFTAERGLRILAEEDWAGGRTYRGGTR